MSTRMTGRYGHPPPQFVDVTDHTRRPGCKADLTEPYGAGGQAPLVMVVWPLTF